MKLTQKLSLGICAGIITLSTAVIQAATIPATGPIPFSAYDTDGSGGISKREFTAVREQRQAAVKSSGRLGRGMVNAPSFNDIDVDNNGFISSQELTNYQAERRSGSGMGRGGMNNQ